MSESNSPSDEENQELSSELDENDKTDANLVRTDKSQLDEAMLERESLETIAPVCSEHGWLEQFECFGGKAFDELKKVALQGLNDLETELLLALAIKLVSLAQEQDPHAIEKFDALWEAAH